MSKGNCPFTKTNIKRACEAVEMAGKRVSRVEIDRAGKIILVIDNEATVKSELELSDIRYDRGHAPPSPAAPPTANHRHGKAVWYVRVGKGPRIKSARRTDRRNSTLNIRPPYWVNARRQKAAHGPEAWHGWSIAIVKRRHGLHFRWRRAGSVRTSSGKSSKRPDKIHSARSTRRTSQPAEIAAARHHSRRGISSTPCAVYLSGRKTFSSSNRIRQRK